MTVRRAYRPVAVAAAAATASLLLPRPISRHPPIADPSGWVNPVRAAMPDQSASGCVGTVDESDPLAVADTTARWLYCGSGPAGILSPHGRVALAQWSSVELPASPPEVVSVGFVDPRAAPVVVSAVVRRSSDSATPRGHRVVLTLFPRSAGGWVVDDVTIPGG